MGSFSQGGIGIATVLAVSGGVILMAFRNSSLMLRYAYFKQLVAAPYVQQARAIYFSPSVLLPARYFLHQEKKITALSRERTSKDLDITMDARSASPTSGWTSVKSSPQKKKKVRFASSVVEPKGDNREYRRNPRSSQLQAKEQLMSQATGEEQDVETGLDLPQNASSQQQRVTDTTLSRPNSAFEGKSKRVSSLFDPRLPRNRVPLYFQPY